MAETPELHAVFVWLTGHPGTLQYVFRSREAALKQYENASESLCAGHPVMIRDDFGRELSAKQATVVAVQCVDCAAELNGQAELAILQAHAQQKLQKRAQQDPMLGGRPVIVGAPGNGPLPFMPPGGRA